jgi:hypothetical protein
VQQRLIVETIQGGQQQLEEHAGAACLAKQTRSAGDNPEEGRDRLQATARAGRHDQHRQLEQVPHDRGAQPGPQQQVDRARRRIRNDRQPVRELPQT